MSSLLAVQRAIQPVVEGHGDVAALPVLVRRILTAIGAPQLAVNPPIRRPRAHLVTKQGLQKAVELACLQENCAAVLVVFDSDDDCPREILPRLVAWAAEVAGSVPCGIVLANREYEAWFLAAIESLRGQRRISSSARRPVDPEEVRDAKGYLNEYLPETSPYTETRDQPALSARLDIDQAAVYSRSFRKLLKEVRSLADRVLAAG